MRRNRLTARNVLHQQGAAVLTDQLVLGDQLLVWPSSRLTEVIELTPVMRRGRPEGQQLDIVGRRLPQSNVAIRCRRLSLHHS
jgi:hypothetical protein